MKVCGKCICALCRWALHVLPGALMIPAAHARITIRVRHHVASDNAPSGGVARRLCIYREHAKVQGQSQAKARTPGIRASASPILLSENRPMSCAISASTTALDSRLTPAAKSRLPTSLRRPSGPSSSRVSKELFPMEVSSGKNVPFFRWVRNNALNQTKIR